jgi:hypothetical protein
VPFQLLMNPQDTYNPGRERVQPTATPNIVTERARMDPQASANALVSALGADSVQHELTSLNQQHEAKKLEEQKGKFDWYVEQFSKDHTGGAVSQAQVQARFPETVPVISSRITEALGQKAGKQQMQAIVEEISNDDALRLDTNARAAYLAKKRAELTSNVGTGNEFYGAGLVQGIDKTLAQHEINWQTQTAAYHEKVQAEQFTAMAVKAFTSADVAKGLLRLDDTFSRSSSLNSHERNKLIVEAAIDHAFATKDESILAQVPLKFLNVDSKAHMEKAKVQMIDRRMTDRRMADELVRIKLEEDHRALQLKIIADVVAGKTIDPAAYRATPEGFAFAMQMREVPRLDASQSHATAQAIRQEIITQATTGNAAPSLKELTDMLAVAPRLNPKERQALIEELPKLIEGRNLMADDMVRQPVSDRLAPRLTALESSTNSAIQTLLTGRNLRSEVMRGYDNDIRRSFNAEYEETGKWPTGHRKLELIDKAVDRAEKRLEQATKIGNGTSAPEAPAAPAPTPRAADVPAAKVPRSGRAEIDNYLAETDKLLKLTPGTSARQINQESQFNPQAVSPRGARGLAQVMPETLASLSERFGRKLDPHNERDALEMHRELMRENMAKFGNEDGALQAYNAGWTPADWNNKETRGYLQSIKGQKSGGRLPVGVIRLAD